MNPLQVVLIIFGGSFGILTGLWLYLLGWTHGYRYGKGE